MSRRVLAASAFLASMAVFSSLAFAQGRGFGRGGGFGGGFGGGGVLGLAGLKPIQEELGVDKDAELVAKLTKLLEDFGVETQEAVQKAGGGDFFALQGLSEDERQKVFQKIQEGTQQVAAKFIPELKKLLKPEQFERLQQISYQQQGSAALLDKDVSKALEISKEQTEKVTAINADFASKQRELFQSAFGGSGDIQETMRKVQELSAERDKKATEVLSKEQQEKYAKLRGRPYDLEKLRAAFGRGFGGGRGGRGGAGRSGGQAEPKDAKKDEKKAEKK